MKIAFRAEGNTEIGTGHLARCYAVAAGCMNLGHEVCFFSRKHSDYWLRDKRIPTQILPECNAIQEESNMFVSLASGWGANYTFIDSYELTPNCYEEINKKVPTVVIDDYARIPYSVSTLINANVFAESFDYSNCIVKKYLLGSQYIILREEFVNTPLVPFNLKVSRILITMGGADVNNCTPFVLESLCNVQNVQLIVIVGPLFKNLVDIENAASKCKSEVQILYSPNNLAEVFSFCDIAISSASTTTYELCSVGIPTILIQQADNQQMICNFFKRNDSIYVLDEFKLLTKQAVENAVLLLIGDAHKRQRMRESVLSLVSRNGVNNIIKEAFI